MFEQVGPARCCLRWSLPGQIFSALAPVADILPNSSLVDIVFYCGPTHPSSSNSSIIFHAFLPLPTAPLRRFVFLPSHSSLAFSNSLVAKTTHSLAMDHTVEHNEQGHLNHAICAVDPSHVGKPFNDAALDHGPTMIPLAGLDVPFHSCYFWSGIMPF